MITLKINKFDNRKNNHLLIETKILKTNTMRKLFYLILCIALFPIWSISQDVCTAYLPEEGTKLTYLNFDKKGKQTSTNSIHVTSVESKGDTTYYKVHQLISTGKKKDDMENNMVYKCSGDKFVVDMNSVLNQEMMKSYNDATLTVTTNHMIIPSKLEPGMELEDGEFNMVANIEYITTNISARSFYRKVEAVEEITTPAGRFVAFKIKGYIESKIAFMRFAYATTEWYVHNLGIVRSETYDKKKNLMGYTELQKIEK